MEKKLPKVFANQINKNLKNNEKIHISNHENRQEELEQKNEKKTNIKNNQQKTNRVTKTINQKITEIMNTKKYIYKIPVKITTTKEEIITKMIGKNNTNIITLDNQLIKIEDIKDIEIYEKEQKNE